MAKTPAWTRKEGKDPKGGLNAAGRASYNKANPGKPGLKAPQPEGGPRKDSFCARMEGMKKKLTSEKLPTIPTVESTRACGLGSADMATKPKSTVNAAGNYTKPELRKRIVSQVKSAAVQGTGAGQWSARKAQLVAKRYKAAGGGYK
jgi:hypothetical protein